MRRLLPSLALAISLCALSAAAVPAAAERPEKAPIYGPKFVNLSCAPNPNEPTPETFGFVRLNTPGSPTTLSGEIALRDARPNTTYLVEAVEHIADFCWSTSPGAITTNKKGNGRLAFTIPHVEVNGELATGFAVYLVNEADNETYGAPGLSACPWSFPCRTSAH